MVVILYPLPPSVGESLVFPLSSQPFSSSTLPGTALSQEIVVVHLPSCICNPMDCSTPYLAVPHHLLKFAQVHVHCIGDAHPAISFSVTFFFPQSCTASETFPASHLFTSDDQYSKPSASASVLLTSIQGRFPLRLTGLISLLSKGLSGVFTSTATRRLHSLALYLLCGPALTTIHDD